VSDVERVLGWFASGDLVRPDASQPNVVDLALAIRSLCGETSGVSANAGDIARRIGPSDHYVFVLVDGLGSNLIDRLPADTLLRRHRELDLMTVFPSSTAPCLTSIATGRWPAEHGIPGWFTHLSSRGITAVVLPHVARHDQRPLGEHGIPPSEVFPVPATPPHDRDRAWVVPNDIAGSVYTRYSSAGSANLGYERMSDAVASIAARIASASGPTYTYWYIPFVDVAEHQRGPSHPDVSRVLERVQRRIGELASALSGVARIIVTADHGQIEISRHLLEDGDPVLSCLLAPPSCDPLVPSFHVRDGRVDEFASIFRERFGQTWALLTLDQVESLRLFGPGSLSSTTRERLGDFVALNATGESIWYHPTDVSIGSHGGLTRDEMRVPLVLL
jgi:hypothetical protein